MQVIYQNENERRSSGEADSVDTIIYIGMISRYVERKYTKRLGSRDIGI